MGDPFESFFDMEPFMPKPRPTSPMSPMKTDIKEKEDAFELTIDLPGFKKENIQANVKEGYLTVTAETKNETEEKDEKGSFVRKERFSGKCSRSFYVGRDVEEANIKASFENGVLTVDVPKKKEEPKLEEGTSISIG